MSDIILSPEAYEDYLRLINGPWCETCGECTDVAVEICLACRASAEACTGNPSPGLHAEWQKINLVLGKIGAAKSLLYDFDNDHRMYPYEEAAIQQLEEAGRPLSMRRTVIMAALRVRGELRKAKDNSLNPRTYG